MRRIAFADLLLETGKTASLVLDDAWVRDGTTTVLHTPSAIIPTECNYILNSAHPDFRKLRIGPAARFSFDLRMWK